MYILESIMNNDLVYNIIDTLQRQITVTFKRDIYIGILLCLHESFTSFCLFLQHKNIFQGYKNHN